MQLCFTLSTVPCFLNKFSAGGWNLRLDITWHCPQEGGTDCNNIGSLYCAISCLCNNPTYPLSEVACYVVPKWQKISFGKMASFTPWSSFSSHSKIKEVLCYSFLNVELVTILCMEGIFLVLYECTVTERLLSVKFIKC